MALHSPNDPSEVPVRTRLLCVLAAALIAVSALTLAGCASKNAGTDLGLEGAKSAGTASGAGAVTGVASGGATSVANPKATDSSNDVAAGSGSSGTGTSGSSKTGGTSSGGSGSGGSSGTQSSAAGTRIKILWWNDTVNRAPSNAEIVFAGKSYKPAAGKSDSGSIGPCPLGKPLQLVIYPDGRRGAKLIAKFTVDSQMVANSETDAIHVEVRDTGVRVLGNPVSNFVQSFSRP